jgi:NCS1 family nucleobase:cation symporter-1
MFAGVVACLLTINAPIFQGPVSRLLDGADLTWIVGFVISGVTYFALVRIADARQPDGAQLLAAMPER